MTFRGRTTRGPIGVDIGRRFMKAVQLSGDGARGWRVEAALVLPRRGAGGELAARDVSRLAEAMYRQGFEGHDVVVSAPAESVLTASLELPPTGSGAPIEQIVRSEVARTHNREPHSLEVAHWPLASRPGVEAGGRAAPTVSALAVACPCDDAARLLDPFDAVGLNVRALDVNWLAMARAVRPFTARVADGKPSAIFGVADIGWQAARIIVLHGDLVIYERTLSEMGLVRLYDQLKQSFKLDDMATDFVLNDVGLSAPRDPSGATTADPDDEAFKEPRRAIAAHFDGLGHEMQVSLSYALQQNRDADVERVILSGGGAAIPNVAAHLAPAVSFELCTLTTADVVTCPDSTPLVATSPAMLAAVGLAQYRL